MDFIGLALQLAFLVLAFGLRTVVQMTRTGSTGFRLLPRSAPFSERFGVVLLLVAGVLSFLGTLFEATGTLDPVGLLDETAVRLAGAAAAAAGLAVTVVAQFNMGTSWRVGVDPSEVTELVTGGLFRYVRNPIFLGMLLFWAGVAFVAPNMLCLVAPLAGLAGMEVQVRLVEEPYLREVHGYRYLRYASRAGRFFPGIGRIRARSSEERVS
jgi:protein-S-isoprenylcysteine O-methyltransferase Ste14